MALCTRHYRVDLSVGIYDERTGRVDIGMGLKVLRKFFCSEPSSVLRQLTVPGLLIFGEHEVLYDPWRVGKRACRLMPSVQLDVIAGAGHGAIYDKPAEVSARIVDYLRA